MKDTTNIKENATTKPKNIYIKNLIALKCSLIKIFSLLIKLSFFSSNFKV